MERERMFFNRKDRRFLVAGPVQFILIEPDVKRAAWGIVKFCDLMQVGVETGRSLSN